SQIGITSAASTAQRTIPYTTPATAERPRPFPMLVVPAMAANTTPKIALWIMWTIQPANPPESPYSAGIAPSMTGGIIVVIIAPIAAPPTSPPTTPACQSASPILPAVVVSVRVSWLIHTLLHHGSA